MMALIDSAELFVDKSFYCPYCKRVLKLAVQANCGHSLCEDCAGEIEYASKISSPKKQPICPVPDCKQVLKFEADMRVREKRNSLLRKEINNKSVECPISTCSWKGTYKHFLSHVDKHPPEIVEPTSERDASHMLMDIERKRSLESTVKHLRQSAESLIQQAQSIEQLSSEAEPVHRVSANSLRRLQSNLAASSNGSLKRATELGALCFVDERSRTLDARRANDQVHLETSAVSDNGFPVQQDTNDFNQHQFIPRISGSTSIQQLPPLMTPIVSPPRSVPRTHQEQALMLASFADAGASTTTPKRRSRLVPVKLPPLLPTNPLQVTPSSLGNSLQQPLSPTNLNQIPSPQVLVQATPTVLQSCSTVARKLPFDSPTPRTIPQEPAGHCQECQTLQKYCEKQDTKINTMKNILYQTIFNQNPGNKENSMLRSRGYTI